MKPKRERLLPRNGPPCSACGKRTTPRANWGRFGKILPLARTHGDRYHHLCRRCFKKLRPNDRRTPRWGKTGATNRPTPTESPQNGATPPQLVPKPFPPQNARYGAHSARPSVVGCEGATGAARSPLRRRPPVEGPPPARWWAFDATCRVGGTRVRPPQGYVVRPHRGYAR